MVTYFTWTSLQFGKYKGYSLPQIILTDPSYFYWGLGEHAFRGQQDDEAAEIARKSCYIRIPKPDPENWRIEYKISPDYKFLDFSIIDATSATSISQKSTISTHLDLSLPRILGIKNKRKIGYDLIIEKVRHYYFDGKPLTREKCDRFFMRDRNFLVE